jgi:hypothetical protein
MIERDDADAARVNGSPPDRPEPEERKRQLTGGRAQLS